MESWANLPTQSQSLKDAHLVTYIPFNLYNYTRQNVNIEPPTSGL